jgi:hypothetical protein
MALRTFVAGPRLRDPRQRPVEKQQDQAMRVGRRDDTVGGDGLVSGHYSLHGG